MSSFVHLHVHSEYSLRESTLRISELIDFAEAEGAPAIAVTDTNAMYGSIQFYLQAKARGIRPILGVQLTIALDDEIEQAASGRPNGPGTDTCVLLAKDLSGYQALVELVTLAQSRMRCPCVSFSELASQSGRCDCTDRRRRIGTAAIHRREAATPSEELVAALAGLLAEQ